MGDPAGPLATILPAGAVGVELTEGENEDFTARLLAGEGVAIEDASPGRRREFAAGRECARRALRALGLEGVSLPVGANGAPVWPDGVVGSITHKGAYRAAAVARSRDLAGLGIDAEIDARLPEGVLETIASARELDHVERLLAKRPGTHWDRLLFSAKEAAVKAAGPIERRAAGIRRIAVCFDHAADSFAATLPSDAETDGTGVPVEGRWVQRSGLLLVAASPASAS